ncbi:10714_t:CDS:10 [Acaulospora morrowiae]|uniref:10714_t:CDS:1 n=1 Tax=Acaulospora morrowiae TaxID=94023 RepID=A0A9N9CRG9_9GLOM|nr:10714_t:CDS:10 [Acaulospora morrowiae]
MNSHSETLRNILTTNSGVCKFFKTFRYPSSQRDRAEKDLKKALELISAKKDALLPKSNLWLSNFDVMMCSSVKEEQHFFRLKSNIAIEHDIATDSFRTNIQERFKRPLLSKEPLHISDPNKKAKTDFTFDVSFDEYVDSIETNGNEIDDDSEIIDVEPSTDWEFDTTVPSWLKKVMEQHKLLTSQTDPSKRLESAKDPIWWRILDSSESNIVPGLLTKADMSELITVFSSALNVGHPTDDWTILGPATERCLQSLAMLDNDQLRKTGKMVQLEGTHGAILEILKMVKNAETSSLNISLFDDENTTDKIKPALLVEEEDYLNPDVQFILDLVRFTCEMIAKGIPQRKNSERDIDVFIKRHIFSCLDNILDSHFGEMVSRASRDRRAEATDAPKNTEGYHLDWMFTKHDLGKDLPYGREFSLCERTGSKIENKRKILSNTLKVQKTLRDMHRALFEAVSTAGGGFYASINLADLEIPTTYEELGSIVKISRIMLQVKVYNNSVLVLKLMKDRAVREKFIPGKVAVNARLQEFRSPQKQKDSNQTKPKSDLSCTGSSPVPINNRLTCDT